MATAAIIRPGARRVFWFAALAGILAAAGCAGRSVQRLATDTTVDLSGRWNDTDSREVSQALIPQAMDGTWIRDWSQASGGNKPAVIVGVVRNRTEDHIPVA